MKFISNISSKGIKSLFSFQVMAILSTRSTIRPSYRTAVTFANGLILCLNLMACGEKDPITPVDPIDPGDTTKEVFKNYFMKGADMSFVPEVRASGLNFYNLSGQQKDMLVSLKETGVNTIRLRLWYEPDKETSSIKEVTKLAKEVHSLGMKVLLTIHYSDTWADPGQQTKPSKWKDLPFAVLADSVESYTTRVVQTVPADVIQIGNEINGGLLWPEGKYDQPTQMIELIKRGVQAVRKIAPKTGILIHCAGIQDSKWFFERITQVDYDLIGLSYYPNWHGNDLNLLKNTIADLQSQFHKPAVIVETSYPFTLGWDDWTNNVVGLENQLVPGYPATPQGQHDFLLALKSILKDIGGTAGFCYWGAEWVSYKGDQATDGSTFENQAMWDFDGKALPVQNVFAGD